MTIIDMDKMGEALNNKADIDLNNTGVFSTSEGGVVNLTSSTPANASGKEVTSADFFQSNLLNYTTNRILEIPQDIKLELNNGTLTLKAGSKTYKADGIVVIVPSDINYYFTGTTANNLILVYDSSVNSLGVYIQGVNSISSATAPSTGVADTLWFDTTSNKCKITHDNAATWAEIPLPIGVVSCNTTDGFTSIDQVFNGFGYIGSTLFLLPGVKTVVPDGRNEDGTCKNKAPSTVSSVKTETISRAVTAYMFTNFVSSVIAIHHYVCSKTKPIVTETTLWYNPETNLPSQVLSDGTVMTPYEEIPLAKFTSDSTGKITSFEPFTVDSVVNSNASNFSQAGRSYLFGLSMPSNKYINLTLGVSGSTYTAPANGWFSIQVEVSGNNQFFSPVVSGAVGDYGFAIPIWTGGGSIPVRVIVPCTAGRIFKTNYNCTINAVTEFRFIYAQGDQ